MKQIILISTVVLALCSCNVHVVQETESKFREAPSKYPELTFVTVNELKNILYSDSSEYKVIIYNRAFINSGWNNMIKEELIPKWKSMDTTKVRLYIISLDCAYLDDMNSFFIKNGIDKPRYVIRDSTEKFCSYKFTNNKTEYCIRLTMITQTLCGNSSPITVKISPFTSLVLDKNNNMKLVETNYKGKLQIVPLPFELMQDNLDETDFSTIAKYNVPYESWLYYSYYYKR
ncbi:MAG: hypothetical protein MJZ93_06020 [Paludibacteraceae bacterium]|nr:hypothetical protein [Paludibacteraceae bacterium]